MLKLACGGDGGTTKYFTLSGWLPLTVPVTVVVANPFEEEASGL